MSIILRFLLLVPLPVQLISVMELCGSLELPMEKTLPGNNHAPMPVTKIISLLLRIYKMDNVRNKLQLLNAQVITLKQVQLFKTPNLV